MTTRQKVGTSKSTHTVAGHPLLVVLSAPSGAGKTTLCNMLLKKCHGMVRAVTCTTRDPRGAERDGIDYHFLTEREFKRRIRSGDFLEHAEVHGNYYGTLKSSVHTALDEGRDIVLVIDVQGARSVRIAARRDARMRRALVDIFIAPPSLKALRARLIGRGEDSPAVIASRIRNASAEMKCRREFQYRVINDTLPSALARLCEIIAAAHLHGAGG